MGKVRMSRLRGLLAAARVGKEPSLGPALRDDKPGEGISHQQDEQGLDEEPAFYL